MITLGDTRKTRRGDHIPTRARKVQKSSARMCVLEPVVGKTLITSF